MTGESAEQFYNQWMSERPKLLGKSVIWPDIFEFAEAYAASALSSLQSKERETRNSTLDEIISLLRQTALQERIEGMSGSGPGALENFADELEKMKRGGNILKGGCAKSGESS